MSLPKIIPLQDEGKHNKASEFHEHCSIVALNSCEMGSLFRSDAVCYNMIGNKAFFKSIKIVFSQALKVGRKIHIQSKCLFE